jgi:lysozyme
VKRIAFFAGLAAAALAGLVVAMLAGRWTPWASRHIQGVDVSWRQGAIDWRALAGDNIAFAYIKASEGGDHVDPRFSTNWEEAGAAGFYRGSYHVFTLCQPGARQAANFIVIK